MYCSYSEYWVCFNFIQGKKWVRMELAVNEFKIIGLPENVSPPKGCSLIAGVVNCSNELMHISSFAG